MLRLNRDTLREVLDQILKEENPLIIEKFMLAGKEPFYLVLDVCKKSKIFDINRYGITTSISKLHHDKRTQSDNSDVDTHIITFHKYMPLFNPISVAIASTIKFLELTCFTPQMIPMIQSIDRELDGIHLHLIEKELTDVLKGCINIPNVKNGVHIQMDGLNHLCRALKLFSIPCDTLTIDYPDLYLYNKKELDLKSTHLNKIQHLQINSTFLKKRKYLKEVKQFVTFLSINFPNLKTINVDFNVATYYEAYNHWDWNDNRMANLFEALPHDVEGTVTYRLHTSEFLELPPLKYYSVELNRNVPAYFKTFQLTKTFGLKLINTFEHPEGDDFFEPSLFY